MALAAERRAYLEAHTDELDATGRRLVVGNGYARTRQVVTGAGAIEVTAPRVDDRREGCRFSSAILPAYMRKSPKVTEVLPILYLRGLSTGDFAPRPGRALRHRSRTFVLDRQPIDGCLAGRARRVVRAGPFGCRLRLPVGGRGPLQHPPGRGPAVLPRDRGGAPRRHERAGGAGRWLPRVHRVLAEVLRGLRDRGLVAPVLAVGDRALGFLGRPARAVPSHQRAALLGACHQDEFSAFEKAVVKITGQLDVLLAYYDFPKEHWIHLRTADPEGNEFCLL